MVNYQKELLFDIHQHCCSVTSEPKCQMSNGILLLCRCNHESVENEKNNAMIIAKKCIVLVYIQQPWILGVSSNGTALFYEIL